MHREQAAVCGVPLSFGRHELLVNPELLAPDRPDGYYLSLLDAAAIAALPHTRVLRGRGETLFYEHEGLHLLLRQYCRGGLYGRIIRRSYLRFFRGSRRSFLEFELLLRLSRAGARVPVPVLAHVSHHLLFVRNAIVLQELEHCRNLAQIMAERPLDAEETAEVCRQLQVLLELGVVHTDLNVRNILLDHGRRAYVVDFDKCFIRAPLDRRDRRAMMLRLRRSCLKEQRIRSRAGLPFHCSAEFLSAMLSLAGS